ERCLAAFEQGRQKLGGVSFVEGKYHHTGARQRSRIAVERRGVCAPGDAREFRAHGLEAAELGVVLVGMLFQRVDFLGQAKVRILEQLAQRLFSLGLWSGALVRQSRLGMGTRGRTSALAGSVRAQGTKIRKTKMANSTRWTKPGRMLVR